MSVARLPTQKKAGFSARGRVIYALLVKDTLGRFGHNDLGFFWIIGEPMLFTLSVMIMWSFAHISHGEGVEVVPFALTGYSFITMWRHITARSMGSASRLGHLAWFPQIRLLDPLMALVLLEIIACFAAFTVAYVPLSLLGLCPLLSDPLTLIGGYVLTGVFAMGFGMLLCGLMNVSSITHHVVPPLMYITIPLTGIFTMQSWLPASVRSVLSWSPLVNGVEMFRSGMFPPDVETIWSAKYLIVCDFVVLILGYWMFTIGHMKSDNH